MKNRTNVRWLTQLALLAAILLVMNYTPLGYLQLGPLSASLLTVPVAIGAMTMGPLAGAILGGIFGATSFIQMVEGKSAMGAALFSVNPFGAFVVSFVARVLEGLCAALICTITGASVHAENGALHAPQDTKAASAAAEERASKEETVYVIAGADGKQQSVIVSDWLKNPNKETSLQDVSDLTDIENVKGDETWTANGTSLTWDAQGNDIYYQGKSETELPVTMNISYQLDGKDIAPAELAGKSGKVTIRFEYENNQYEVRTVNGVSQKVYVPFVALTGALLELYADDTQEIQVMASGDDHDMKAVSLAQNGDTLTLEQSAAALSPLPLSARWLQVTVRIPRAWKGRVEIRTTSGSVHVRGLQVSDLSVESLSGFVMLSDLSSLSLKVKNGSGDIAGSDLSGQDCSLFTTTGMLCLERLAFLNISLSSVSRGAMLSFAEMFSTFKGGSVAGGISLEIPGAQCDAILRSVSGRLLTDGVSIVNGAPSVRVTTASGNLTIRRISPEKLTENE